MASAFQALDTNGDGSLSRQEWAAAQLARAAPQNPTQQQLMSASKKDPERAKLIARSKDSDDDSESSIDSQNGSADSRCGHAYSKAKRCLGHWIVKWIMPMFLFAGSTLISMWLLHVGTFYYVKIMDRMEAVYILNPNYKDEDASYLSPGLSPTDVSYGSLQDPIEAQLGWKKVNLKTLDLVAAFFPCVWGILVLLTGNLQNWTKILMCNAALAIGKGAFAAMTTVPDSIGWAHCKERLGPVALEFFRNEVPDPTKHGVWSTWMTILGAELFGPGFNRIGSGMRFCGDMVYSGHTYFTVLYILAFCELLRMETKRDGSLLRISGDTKRKVVLGSLYMLCILEQCLEITLVIQNRFHYTLDVVMAVVMTLLWYTSAPICIAAKWWTAFGTKHWHHRVTKPEHLELSKAARDEGFILVPRDSLISEGDVWVPAFCIPFCCLNGRHHLISDKAFDDWGVRDQEKEDSDDEDYERGQG
eukprot:gb/GFBE01000001.1/.p1 GENE.gb/GFBE01000001.1/~~gb/GFBE01000001.1/.p1  ORF type:complete len:474 (+),score=66.58 gb/GFBE01000001.1/:1-1422(+)